MCHLQTNTRTLRWQPSKKTSCVRVRFGLPLVAPHNVRSFVVGVPRHDGMLSIIMIISCFRALEARAHLSVRSPRNRHHRIRQNKIPINPWAPDEHEALVREEIGCFVDRGHEGVEGDAAETVERVGRRGTVVRRHEPIVVGLAVSKRGKGGPGARELNTGVEKKLGSARDCICLPLPHHGTEHSNSVCWSIGEGSRMSLQHSARH